MGKQPVAIMFDTFGSVVDWRTSLIDELTAFGKQRGIEADWVGLVDAWRAAYHPSMQRVRSGEMPWTLLDDLHRASLDTLIEQFNVKGLSEEDRQHINRGWHRLRPWPDSVAGLKRLKTKFIIGPMSNGNTSLLLNMAKNMGIPWDVVLGSDLYQHFKPDPEVYLGISKTLGLRPDQVMLGAAHNRDLAAAQKCGLMTAFFPRPSEYGPHQKIDFEATFTFDYVAKNIEDLATQLGV